MSRSMSVNEVLEQRLRVYPFEGRWAENFGQPNIGSKWFVWGESASGKSSFVMQLGKYMTRFGRVEYYPVEEGLRSVSLQRRLHIHQMEEVNSRFLLCDVRNVDELMARMSRRNASSIYIIDSFQMLGLSYKKFAQLCNAFPNKTIIFVSQADGKDPKGASARSAKFDCDVKVYVQGYAATCQGRFMPTAGGRFVIWEEGFSERLKTI